MAGNNNRFFEQQEPFSSGMEFSNPIARFNSGCMVPEILVSPQAKPEFAIYSGGNFARIFLLVVHHHPLFSSPPL